jgi:2-methylcitrate dehydratase PrpD
MAIVTPGVLPASKLVTAQHPPWLLQCSEFARALRFEHLPADVVDRARLVILDCLGAIIAGRREAEVSAVDRRFRAAQPGSSYFAAFVGGTAGTSLEIDEGNQYARGHPGIHVVPAVLATVRNHTLSGGDAIAATALGYEIGARIGIASKLHVAMHPHGTWGTVGAAVAVGKAYNATTQDFVELINIASSLGLTTSRRTMLEGATVRNTYAGFSNMLGMMAWDLVQAGFKGEADGIGSVYGGVAADDWKPDEMTRDLGTRWEIARNYFKRHAACRYSHGALDALAKILADAGGRIDPATIAAIKVETYVWAAQLDHSDPKTMLSAKFSIPFALATFIINGAATLDAFRDEARADRATRALAAKVQVDELAEFTQRLPGQRPARVTVRLTDGRTFAAEVLTNKGDTEDPYTSGEVVEKFFDVAGPALGQARCRSIVDAALTLEKAPSLTTLVELCEAA